MKVIICGGRDARLLRSDYDWLNNLRVTIPLTAVLSGHGRGVDRDAEEWAHRHGLPVTLFPADWETHGPRAGPLRNEAMARVAQGCIAFPGGRGTEDMLRRARQHGLQIWRRDTTQQLSLLGTRPGAAAAASRARP